MTRSKLVGSTASTWGDLKDSVVSLMGLASHQMSLMATQGIYRSAELERLSLETLKISRDLSLVNSNCFNNNAQAIDLESTDGKLGIQVTLGVKRGKAKTTLDSFTELSQPGGRLANMEKVWILGIRDATSQAKTLAQGMTGVEVRTLLDALQLDNLDEQKLFDLQSVLKRVTRTRVDSRPNLKESLQRFVDFLDRPAVTDSAGAVYENWEDCLAVLDNAVYLAKSGTWAETDARRPSKADYVIPMRELPQPARGGVRRIVSQITHLRNNIKTENPSRLPMQGQAASSVDVQRAALRAMVNEFCRDHQLTQPFDEVELK